MKSKGANQYGRYIWMPNEQSARDAKYSARIFRKGLSVRANSDSKDDLVNDMGELLERLTPLAPIVEESGKDEDKD